MCFGVPTQIQVAESQKNCAHITTALLSWHMQKYLLTKSLESLISRELEFSCNLVKFQVGVSKLLVKCCPGAHFTRIYCLTHHNSNLMAVSFNCNSISCCHITTKFGTCHSKCAVMSCAEICGDELIRIWMRAKMNFRWWLVKCSPGGVCMFEPLYVDVFILLLTPSRRLLHSPNLWADSIRIFWYHLTSI